MATTVAPARTKPAGYLLFPWTLTSIVLILVLNIFLKDWFGRNASWISLVLVVPAAIIENIKLGYSSMRVMYLKIFYSLLSFLIVGLTLGLALAGWYYERFQGINNIPRLDISWIVLLAIFILMLIEMAHIFTLLKAVKREFVQYDTEG
ncbi:MAG TPA: hypothetical protein VD993_13595 [Chitinophagaceae bacterium]|nr:hypothetical protein [Chitinophagaceae bacterium]